MRQGTASSIPETWTKYASVEEARAGAKHMYHDDRVLRVMLVVDGTSSFVEWIDANVLMGSVTGKTARTFQDVSGPFNMKCGS